MQDFNEIVVNEVQETHDAVVLLVLLQKVKCTGYWSFPWFYILRSWLRLIAGHRYRIEVKARAGLVAIAGTAQVFAMSLR